MVCAWIVEHRERQVVESEKRIEYYARKQRWKEMLEPDTVWMCA